MIVIENLLFAVDSINQICLLYTSIPWRKPWVACGAAISYATGKPYSLLNQMLLGKAGEYLTFKQVQSVGGHVRKGEKSHMVVFWKFLMVEDEDTKEEKQVPLLRYYNVFHIDQCEGITAKHIQPLAHNAEPVSYTHLDVYKRQGRGYPRPSRRFWRGRER